MATQSQDCEDDGTVLVVGGGVAGLTLGIELARLNQKVTIIESNAQLGGKASSRDINGRCEDHGFHIFPPWYRNTWRLIDEAGCRNKFKDNTAYYQLRMGEFPRFRILRSFTVRNIWQNLFNGAVPANLALLANFAMLDVIVRFRRSEKLRDVTLTEFLSARFYNVSGLANDIGDLLQAAHAITADEADASILSGVAGAMLGIPAPIAIAATTDLDTALVAPLVNRFKSLGGRVITSTVATQLLSRSNNIIGIACERPDGDPCNLYADTVVLAVPPDQLNQLTEDSNDLESETLSNAGLLPMRRLSALHFSLLSGTPGIPNEHVRLVSSELCLTFIDVAAFQEKAPPSVLNAVIGNPSLIEDADEDEIVDRVLKELDMYGIRIERADIGDVVLQLHDDAKIFAPIVGTWRNRPTARTDVSGLYVTGDYCRTWVVLPTIEAAVVSGLQTAEAIRSDIGLQAPPIAPLGPIEPNRSGMRVLWCLALPIAQLVSFGTNLYRRVMGPQLGSMSARRTKGGPKSG
jgi:15-cis-phytoene desaturase